MDRFEGIKAELEKRYRTFRLIPKEESGFMKALYYGALMFLWCPGFMTDYTTVIIARVYMPRSLIGTEAGYLTLRHERVHIEDCFRWGVLPFVLSYLFVLPTVLSLRAHWEMRAYRETLRAEMEMYGEVSDARLEQIRRQFTSSAYFWMFPFPKTVHGVLTRARAALEKEKTGRRPG
jgi:hypothetical protein